MEDLEAAIAEMQKFLAWEDDWDGDGAPRFLKSTVQRAADFAKRNALRMGLVTPDFIPVGNGSIDIEWTIGTREIAVTIPIDLNEPAGVWSWDPIAEKQGKQQ